MHFSGILRIAMIRLSGKHCMHCSFLFGSLAYVEICDICFSFLVWSRHVNIGVPYRYWRSGYQFCYYVNLVLCLYYSLVRFSYTPSRLCCFLLTFYLALRKVLIMFEWSKNLLHCMHTFLDCFVCAIMGSRGKFQTWIWMLWKKPWHFWVR